MSQKSIAALYMRGGTSKGVFLRANDLPSDPQERDTLLARILGSPDPWGRQTDGMGGATAATSKVVLLAPSRRDDSDVDYLFGQVALDSSRIDWSGHCADLTAAVGPYALWQGWVKPAPGAGRATVRLWQQNLGRRIVAHVPMCDGKVQEDGSFREDGVAFPGAEISLEYLDAARPDVANGGDKGDKADKSGDKNGKTGLLPTGNASDVLEIPELGPVRVTLINAGDPTIFVRADALGLTGREMPEAVNRNTRLLAKLEAIRAHGAVAMRLARNAEETTRSRPGAPALSFIAKPASYRSSVGEEVSRESIDVLGRILSMGKLHPAYTGPGSIALAIAAALPGSVVSEVTRTLPGVPTRIGHVSGVMAVGAFLAQDAGGWSVEKVVMSHSARRIMEGVVYVPDGGLF